jgi:hypothetical protein
MKPPSAATPTASWADLGPAPPAYQRLQDQLRQSAWLCQGTVVARPLIRRIRGRKLKKGPYYLWTCKLKGRTLCVALSKNQYDLLAQAIENNRRLQKALHLLQSSTLKTVLKKVPGVRKRK